ncbi:hypothetical protein NADFUDRAFT_60681 [Nadsonia fulvescens var. elongata DSM 6958]|uniref:histidine kinase n=1 Tax=Nadsonia fulvescens var. elongata DSM 6958 TaxID=857566 RepID=A0A1E3PH84_9ASCO|nr:hypothetical protein NADFUDRAFT_60681 [Nadsonia fulvescens var. elongata DSM 6958]
MHDISRSKLIEDCLRPLSYVRVSESPSNYALVYNNDKDLRSLYEVFLADSRSSGKRPSSTNAPRTHTATSAAASTAEPKTNDKIVRILKCIINVLQTLVQAHRRRITHNALSTSSIFLDSEDNTHIGYWDFSFRLHSEDPCRGYRRKNIREMSFFLPYISPEATGLMNRVVDFRADLYAIGCILYELLLGFPPFRSNDPQDLCTMHVASQPVAPALTAPWVPQSLSDLILQLLEKCACDRYQCSEQVIEHLAIIIDALEILKSFDSIKISSQFLVSQLIFGRDVELNIMKQFYNTISNKIGSSFQFLVLKGDSGTGKTRLILEMEKFFISEHGFFSIAKFDKYSRGPPFFTLIKVLQDLVHQVLSGSQSKIQKWRDTILSSIKHDLDMLTASSQGIGPVKREMRLKFVVKSLFCLFGTFGLAVFLDDIQWSSQEEFNFFKDLRSFAVSNDFSDTKITFTCAAMSSSSITGSALSSISTVEARRLADNCESLLKPFKDNADFSYQEIELSNLSHRDPNFQSHSNENSEFELLVDLIYNQTQGNALFLNIMVRYLYRFDFLYFHEAIGTWKINSQKLKTEKARFPKSVEEAIIQILNILPRRIVQLLKYAACICSKSFTLEDLAISVGFSFGATNESLYSAAGLDLIVPLSAHYKYGFSRARKTVKIKKPERSKIARSSTFKFYHDIVQQAIRSTLSRSEEEQIHRIIGMRLLRSHNLKFMPKQKVLEIANQLRLAVDIAKKDDYENSIYRDINIKAGKFVYAISDFVMAYNYFNIARLFLPEDCWSSNNPELLIITKEIHISLIELQYLKREFEPCLELIDYTLKNSGQGDMLSRVRCLKIKIKVLSLLGRHDEAISVALTALSLSGLELNEADAWNMEKISPNIPLSVTEIRELADLPVAKDVKTVLTHELLVSIILICFFSDRQRLLRAITYTAVETCIKMGSCPICSYAFIALGALFQTEGDEINLTRAYEYSKLAIMALESETTLEMDFGINIYDFYTLTLASFHEPLSEITRYYDIVACSGLQSYDNDGNVTLTVVLRPMCQFLCGESLATVSSEFSRCRSLFINNQSNQTNFYNVGIEYIEFISQFINSLSGISTMDSPESQFPEINDYPSLPSMIEAPFESSNRHSVEISYGYYICRLVFAVIFNNRAMIMDLMLYKLPPLISRIPVTIYHQFVVFYGSLALLELPERNEQQEEMLNSFAQTLSDWSSIPANNVRHKHLLIQAELNKGKINSISLLDTYEEASKLAVDQGYIHDAAIINERCGDWVLSQSTNRGLSYFQEACRLYRQWGSEKKVQQIKSIKGLSDDNLSKINIENNTSNSNFLSNNYHSAIESTNDYLKPALQVCLEISESIDVETIILRLMQSVVTLGGCDYSIFISVDDIGGLYLESVGTLTGVSILRHEPLTSRADLVPFSVVESVLSTGQLLVRNADFRLFDSNYGRDPYYANRTVPLNSVLCVPVQNHLKTIGLLYLECQRLDFDFTASKIDLITLLASQSAISIEKAKIYKQMDLAKKAAEEATAEKASFLANMSHEIRTPFNALLSCSIFLLDTDLQEIQREYVETIRSSAMLTLDIIDAILAFSKIEHGSVNLDNSPFSLRACVDSAVQLVAEPAAAKDLELVHIYRSGIIDTVYGDVTRFRQIIINLVGNAVKFTPKGHIIVETRSEKLSTDNRYEIVISVTDTGIGIPKDSRNKVFRAFSQVDGSSRRVYGGAGLGLAISKKLAELMGGTLTFESVEGKSTVFRFATVIKADPPEPAQIEAAKNDKMCIVCDFSSISKTALKLDLLNLGFKFIECGTDESILSLVESSPKGTYSMIFVDYRKVDLKSKRALRVLNYDSELHIILMTHFGAQFPRDNIRQLGFSAVLLRPYQQIRLTNVIKQMLMTNNDENFSKDKEISGDMNSQNISIGKGFIKSMGEHHPLKILLAEDNMINTRVALQHLKRMGYLEVHHAKDGVEVIEYCQRELSQGNQMYDVVLMDIQMPRKDGIAAAKEIREMYDENIQPSIIALTANVGGDDKEKCLNAGMVNYLAKPILPPDLAAVLMSVKPISSRESR